MTGINFKRELDDTLDNAIARVTTALGAEGFGVKLSFEECETAYATDRGVECYERLKGKGATVFQPLSTGVTFALTEKAPVDKIPLITAGSGRRSKQASSSASSSPRGRREC